MKNIELHWHTLGTFPHWALYLFCIAPCTGFYMTNTISTVRNSGGSKHHAVGVFLSGRTLSAVQAEWRMKEAKCKVWQAWRWSWHQFRFIHSCRVKEKVKISAFIVQRKHTEEAERHQMKCMRLTQRTLANWEQLKKNAEEK